MATGLLPFQPTGVRACATPGNRKPESQSQKSSSSSSKWWTPLFSWSSEPDYIDSENNVNNKYDLSAKAEAKPDSDLGPMPMRSRIAPGSFTEEKARKLRMMTKDTAFHDAMYHSAIASRLAFDHSDRSDL